MNPGKVRRASVDLFPQKFIKPPKAADIDGIWSRSARGAYLTVFGKSFSLTGSNQIVFPFAVGVTAI